MEDNMELSFDDMVQRKRAETIANATLGKNRHNVPTGPAKMPKGGVGKRPSSGSGIGNGTTGPNGRWMHDLHHKNNPHASRVSKLPTTLPPQVARSLQGNRLYAALHGDNLNIIPSGPKNKNGISIRGGSQGGVGNGMANGGISIRGAAGPFVVQASNFANGTTAEDIKMAMNKFGKILSCILLSAQPTVICELVFDKKESAERCIAQFNNQIADGRILHVQFKPGPPVSRLANKSHHSYRQPQTPEEHNAQREEADRQRRMAAVSFQDGSYGVRPPPLYSDALVQRGRGFNR